MVKVNLLPSEMGKTKKAATSRFLLSLPDFSKLSVFFFYLALVFFVGGIFLRAETMFRKRRLLSIDKEYRQAQETSNKINKLKKEETELGEETGLLKGFANRELLWSEKLIRLRQLIPKEVWLTRLSFEKRPEGANMSLRGGLLPQDKSSPLASISRFVNQLKEDKLFLADFSTPDLKDFRTEFYKNTEIMTFAIDIPYKKEGKAG